MKDLFFEIINHEVWIEVDDERAYLRWGHYLKVDDELNPRSIVRAFAIVRHRVLPAVVSMNKESSAKGALLDVLAVKYSRGVYSLTEDKKWIFSKNVPAKHSVKEKLDLFLAFTALKKRQTKFFKTLYGVNGLYTKLKEDFKLSGGVSYEVFGISPRRPECYLGVSPVSREVHNSRNGS